MNDAAFKRLIETNDRITREIKHTDFTVEQLKTIKYIYSQKRFLNIAEAAVYFEAHYNTVYRWINEGRVLVKDGNVQQRPILIDLPLTLIATDWHKDE